MDNPIDQSSLIQAINQTLSQESHTLQLMESLTLRQLEEALAARFDDWIRSDFAALLQFLYRIDVNEKKLRTLLKENTEEDAGMIIARLVIERQLQKIQTRRSFKPGASECDEEKW